MTPRLSIVMATYNMKREYLKVAIRSVLNQTAKDEDFEVVVVGLIEDDNWSLLETASQQYGDHLRLVEADRANVYHQRNLGMQAAKGEFVSFFDSDDFMFPNKVAQELATADSAKLDMCWSGFYYADESLTIRSKWVPEQINLATVMNKSQIPDCAIFRREAARKLGWLAVEKYNTACVMDMFLKMISFPDVRMGAFPFPTWLYRQRLDSLSHRMGGQDIIDRERAVEAYKVRMGIKGPPVKMEFVSIMTEVKQDDTVE